MQPRPDRRRPPIHACARTCALALAAALASPADAQPSGRATYSCYAGGRVVKSDQAFVDCLGVQTRSFGGIEERMLKPAEAERQDKCKRDGADALADWRTRDREDKNLVAKYPEAAALRKQRDADLQALRESVGRSQTKLADLDKERTRLALEREFYPRPGTMPERLQRQIDDNDALIVAQQLAKKRAEDDIARITTNFDALEKKMKLLWAGRAEPAPRPDCSVETLFGPIPRR